MNTLAIFIVVIVIALTILYFMPASTQGGDKPVVYGSMNCGYTVKLRESIGQHEFVDCTKEKCPEFVEGYPTTVYPDGVVKVGA
jgi:hypothetical protein